MRSAVLVVPSSWWVVYSTHSTECGPVVIRSRTSPKATPSRFTTFKPIRSTQSYSSLEAAGKLLRGRKIRQPRKASAALRSSTPPNLATIEPEWVLASSTLTETVPEKDVKPGRNLASGACKNQDLAEKSASGSVLCDRTFIQPFTPHASRMRPTSMASSGRFEGAKPMDG